MLEQFDKFKKDPIFGMEFTNYTSWCDGQQTTTQGRVFFVMIAHRFHRREEAARVTAVDALFSIRLGGNTDADVSKFISRIRHAFTHLQPGDIYDVERAYVWLHTQLQHYQGI